MRALGLFLDELFSYAEDYMSFLGRDICDLEGINYETVSKIFKRAEASLSPRRKDLLLNEAFSFIHADGYIIADGERGYSGEEDTNISAATKSNLRLAQSKPWELIVSKTDKNSITDEDIIVASLGIKRGNEFLGTVNITFKIQRLRDKVHEVLNLKYYRCLVLDEELEPIVNSDNVSQKLERQEILDMKDKINYLLSNSAGWGGLNQILHAKNADYVFYYKSKLYPYYILIGIREGLYNADQLEECIVSRVENKEYVEAFMVALVYLFKTKFGSRIEETAASFKDFCSNKLHDEDIKRTLYQLDKIQNYVDLQVSKEVSEELARERLDLLREKQEFMRAVAHDIRGPIGAIRGATNLFDLFEYDPNEVRKIVPIINDSCDKVLTLIESVRMAANMFLGEFREEREVCRIHKAIQEVIENNSIALVSKGLYIKYFNTIPEEKDTVQVDCVALKRMLDLLVTNSLKYTSDGGFIINSYSKGDDTIIMEFDYSKARVSDPKKMYYVESANMSIVVKICNAIGGLVDSREEEEIIKVSLKV